MRACRGGAGSGRPASAPSPGGRQGEAGGARAGPAGPRPAFPPRSSRAAILRRELSAVTAAPVLSSRRSLARSLSRARAPGSRASPPSVSSGAAPRRLGPAGGKGAARSLARPRSVSRRRRRPPRPHRPALSWREKLPPRPPARPAAGRTRPARAAPRREAGRRGPARAGFPTRPWPPLPLLGPADAGRDGTGRGETGLPARLGAASRGLCKPHSPGSRNGASVELAGLHFAMQKVSPPTLEARGMLPGAGFEAPSPSPPLPGIPAPVRRADVGTPALPSLPALPAALRLKPARPGLPLPATLAIRFLCPTDGGGAGGDPARRSFCLAPFLHFFEQRLGMGGGSFLHFAEGLHLLSWN